MNGKKTNGEHDGNANEHFGRFSSRVQLVLHFRSGCGTSGSRIAALRVAVAAWDGQIAAFRERVRRRRMMAFAFDFKLSFFIVVQTDTFVHFPQDLNHFCICVRYQNHGKNVKHKADYCVEYVLVSKVPFWLTAFKFKIY